MDCASDAGPAHVSLTNTYYINIRLSWAGLCDIINKEKPDQTKLIDCLLFDSFVTSLIFYYFLQVLNSTCLRNAHQGLYLPVLLVYDLGVLKMIRQLERALVAGVADIADFGGLVLLPLLQVELLIELLQIGRVDKVDESVPYVAVILN